ncbi:putative membrane-associated kinase regulator 3 [Capsicum chinense]|nr:putative membrane-associated kinase regulator 3 [Capsicum chinense]
MATNNPPSSSISSSNIKNEEEQEEEEDYIDMEVTSSSSCSSPQISREFEFQMASISINDKDSTTTTTTSPADELFYRGKLLPLHLPPRLEMVQKLLTSSKIESFQLEQQQDDERFTSISTNNLTNTNTPFDSSNQKLLQTSKIESFQEHEEARFSISTNSLMNAAATTTSSCTNTGTPYESCNISPSESCRVSCELNPDEYYFEWSTEFSTFFKDSNNHPKMKSWSKKLKLVKQSLISQKLKASTSKAYINLKSLFNKSTCSDHQQQVSSNASVIRDIESSTNEADNVNSHRRSFSAAIKKHSPTKCLSSSSSNGSCSSSNGSSSSSFSLNSNGFYELNFLKRSSSATTEIEGSIEAAI